MLSLQGFFLRQLLLFRKRFVRWDAPVDYFRSMLDRSESLFKPLSDVKLKQTSAGGVPCEWLIPVNASGQGVLLYLHGGGWTLGWTNFHRQLAARIGRASAVRVLAPDYRLAPECPFPAALDDSIAAYRWLLRTEAEVEQIVIAGDSAGGNLTLATLLALRDADDPLPAAAVCLSPMTDLEATGESFRTNNDAALTAAFALTMLRHYAGGQDLRYPLLSPYHGNLHQLPPLLVQVGGDEILLSDAIQFAEKAKTAGVDVTLSIWPKMWHVWQGFASMLPEACHAIDAIGIFVHEHLQERTTSEK